MENKTLTIEIPLEIAEDLARDAHLSKIIVLDNNIGLFMTPTMSAALGRTMNIIGAAGIAHAKAIANGDQNGTA